MGNAGSRNIRINVLKLNEQRIQFYHVIHYSHFNKIFYHTGIILVLRKGLSRKPFDQLGFRQMNSLRKSYFHYYRFIFPMHVNPL